MTNKKVAISAVQEALQALNYSFLVADWPQKTNRMFPLK